MGNFRMMNSIKLPTIVFLFAALTACQGSNYRPVIDAKGQDMSNYEPDLVECQAIAKESGVLEKVGKNAAIGAVTGAIIGSVVGAITGNVGTSAAAGAGYGGTAGGVDGAVSGYRDQEQIVVNCMAGRGYKVLK
jgi:outer membrane lipoprotein SlyB